jgi:hypothetical protein
MSGSRAEWVEEAGRVLREQAGIDLVAMTPTRAAESGAAHGPLNLPQHHPLSGRPRRLRAARALIVPAGFHPVAAYRHRAPPRCVGLAVVDQEQAAFIVRARTQPPGALLGQSVPGEDGSHG